MIEPNDVMKVDEKDWEQFKKDQQQKQFERVKNRVADETGDMFADFDEKTKAGLQEKIEKGKNFVVALVLHHLIILVESIRKKRKPKFLTLCKKEIQSLMVSTKK